MTVEFGCPGCGHAVEGEPGATVRCGRCGHETVLPDRKDLSQCLACGCKELYRHRDFSQKVGIALIVVGAGLWIWLGSFLPMIAAALLDVILYFKLPDVAICYRCKAHHRDFPGIAAVAAFDLERHEHYRFEKAREEGRLPPGSRDA